MPASDYFNFWPFTQSQQDGYQQGLASQVQPDTSNTSSGAGGAGGSSQLSMQQAQINLQQAMAAQQNAFGSNQYNQYIFDSHRIAMDQAFYTPPIRRHSEGMTDLINEISTLCLNASVYITSIAVNPQTFSKFINEIGSTRDGIRMEMDSNTLTIRTDMGPIQIYCDDGKKSLGQVDWDKYMETVEEKV